MADPLESWASSFEPRATEWPMPGDLAKYIDPRIRNTPALNLIDAELADLVGGHGASRRLAVFMPPQEGKSQRCSRTFPTWLLSRDPTLRIAIVSYESEIALRWGRDIKRDLEEHPELGVQLRADSKAAGRWQTTANGGVYCVGVGGPLTGQPVDVLIIDDPVKDRPQAESETYRNRNWDWWENVGSLRLSRRGVVVLMMTRWHEDDLAGRMLKREPKEWRTVSIPAISKGEGDPLGRRAGVELESATKQPGHFHRTKELRSPYVWNSVFQQSPSAAEGGLFKRADWMYWQHARTDTGLPGCRVSGHVWALQDLHRFATVDLAASKKTSADYSVCSVWGITPNADVVLLHRARGRVTEDGHYALVSGATARWFGPYDVHYVEKGFIGSTLVHEMGKYGLQFQGVDAEGDKFTRALPAADLLRQHRFHLPQGAEWLDEWLDEHASFPNATHDDQVDTTSYAARVALAYWLPPVTTATVLPIPSRSSSEVDFMNAEF